MAGGATIAKRQMGHCLGCGLPVEIGETVFERPAGVLHVGCPERAPIDESKNEQWSLTSAPVPAPAVERRGQKASTSSFTPVRLDGPALTESDRPRLAGQLQRTFELLRTGEWFSLSQIAERVGCLETSASSRIRDFRKERFGGHTVVSRPSPSDPRVREYRLIVNNGVRNAA